MCGPVAVCCCCCSIQMGLYIIGVTIILLEIGALAYNLVLILGNSEEYFDATGLETKHLPWILTGLCLLYVSAILLNVGMMIGNFKNYRYVQLRIIKETGNKTVQYPGSSLTTLTSR